MLRLFFIGLLAVLHLSSVTCSCDACINKICYRKIIVLESFEQIGQIAIDRTSNILYFHVKDKDLKSYTCAYDLDHVQLNRIWDVNFSFARAVDSKTKDLYLSLESSVYKVNPAEFYVDGVTVFNATVWHMQYKDKLFYSEFVSTGIKVFENGEHKSIEALSSYQIDEFIVDKNNDIYFSANYSVYRLKHGENKVTLFADDIYAMSTDKFAEAYFVQPFSKGLYKVDYKTDTMVEIGAFSAGTPFKFVFTSENYIIFSDVDFNGMYYMIPDTGKCSVSKGAEKKTTITVSVNNS